MSDYNALLTAASELPIDERISLVEAIWDTVPSETELPLSAEWLAEVQRRSEEYDAGKEPAKSWEQVRDNALRRAGIESSDAAG